MQKKYYDRNCIAHDFLDKPQFIIDLPKQMQNQYVVFVCSFPGRVVEVIFEHNSAPKIV